jgi:hypothetical protein
MTRRLPTSVLRSTTRIPILVSSPAQSDGLNSPVRHVRATGSLAFFSPCALTQWQFPGTICLGCTCVNQDAANPDRSIATHYNSSLMLNNAGGPKGGW